MGAFAKGSQVAVPRTSIITPAIATALLLCAGGTTTRTVTQTVASVATKVPTPAPEVVLGAKEFMGRDGEGWGSAHPSRIFNGGDPSGLVKDIRWTSWGPSTALGTGENAIFKPGGGYYAQLATISLRARARITSD